MLVTRQFTSGRHTWSPNKVGAFIESSLSPRMSNLEPISSQSDWRGNYHQYAAQASVPAASPRFEQPEDSAQVSESQHASRPPLEHRHSIAQLNQRQEVTGQCIERPESAPPGNCGNSTSEKASESALSAAELLSSQNHQQQTQLDTESRHTPPLVHIKPEGSSVDGIAESELKDNDGDDIDDEMFEEDNTGASHSEAGHRGDRRKMKRFRLTHQQTRFLSAEFSKQAHPDAAHRERLSKHIPGLSSRQVQVWFQNRRAKLKRAPADSRADLIKSRSVPDGFDSVQALHSTYGALNTIGTPMMSPVDYQSGYGAQQMMRPLMLDNMRRHDVDEQHMSPTGMSAGFSHMGFNCSGSAGTPDILSPMSLNSPDRYYSNPLTSPMSGPRSSNPFLRQGNAESYHMQNQSRHQARPLQPLQLRETMSRSRSESLQSPLRSSMSWKGDALDYANYPIDNTSPTLNSRQQSMYQSDQNNGLAMGSPYSSGGYTDAPPSSYPTSQPTSSSSTSVVPSLSRYRAASSAYPPSLELRNQYRTLSSHPNSSHTPLTPNHPSTPRHSAFASPFSTATTGYASAPLQAPSDFQLPRTPASIDQNNIGQAHDSRTRDFNLGQMSAPMAPSQEFNYNNQQATPLLSPGRSSLHSVGSRIEQNRDGSDFPAHPTTSSLAALVEQSHRGDGHDAGFGRDSFIAGQDGEGLKRKRTYSMGSYHP